MSNYFLNKKQSHIKGAFVTGQRMCEFRIWLDNERIVVLPLSSSYSQEKNAHIHVWASECVCVCVCVCFVRMFCQNIIFLGQKLPKAWLSVKGIKFISVGHLWVSYVSYLLLKYLGLKQQQSKHDLVAVRSNFSIPGHKIARKASVFSIELICNSRI